MHGLGLRNLVLWNMTCMNKPLWLLMFTHESVSVSWIQDNVIKDEIFCLLNPVKTIPGSLNKSLQRDKLPYNDFKLIREMDTMSASGMILGLGPGLEN